MSIKITMPQLGLTMTEGTVAAWLKNPGDSVKKDDIVLTITTDKVDMDVESPADGTFGKIVVEIGETVPVGTVLAHLLTTSDDQSEVDIKDLQAANEFQPEDVSSRVEVTAAVEAKSSTGKDSAIHQAAISPAETESERIIASPRAKKMAADLKIDLATVKGTGPQNRILAEDVERAVSQAASKIPAAKAHLQKEPVQPDAKRRLIIAERMVKSITTIPAFSVSVEVNAEQLVALYGNVRESIGKAADAKLTYTDLLIKALTIALSRTPQLNSLWSEGALSPHPGVSLGLAVATDRGVMAPTLNGIGQISLEQVVRRRHDLTGRARESKLTLADMEAASGTLSNLGMYRVDHFQGIISPEQTFILAVGRLSKRPWVDEVLTVKPTVILNLSVDHRVADGAVAAEFLQRITEALENPYRLLLNE
jgi:pyruvate dehydrogenase E2 component (dihydrolipoamide acetyltransferase)